MKTLQKPWNVPGGGNKPIDDKKDGSMKIPLPNKSDYGPKS